MNAYPHLRNFGCYLHQDWSLEFSDPDEAIQKFKSEISPEIRDAFCRELDEFVANNLNTPATDLERSLGPVLAWSYLPSSDGLSVMEWLRDVRRQVGS